MLERAQRGADIRAKTGGRVVTEKGRCCAHKRSSSSSRNSNCASYGSRFFPKDRVSSGYRVLRKDRASHEDHEDRMSREHRMSREPNRVPREHRVSRKDRASRGFGVSREDRALRQGGGVSRYVRYPASSSCRMIPRCPATVRFLARVGRVSRLSGVPR